MHTAQIAQAPLTAASLEEWLVTKISSVSGIKPEQIDTTQPFADFGLDSVTLVGLSGELEELLGKSLSPTVVYDYPNIEALAHHLSKK